MLGSCVNSVDVGGGVEQLRRGILSACRDGGGTRTWRRPVLRAIPNKQTNKNTIREAFVMTRYFLMS